MVTIEPADADHVEGICWVCAESWRDAYDGVLPEEYVEANVRLRYDPERVARQIAEREEANGDESNDAPDNDDTEDNDDTTDTDGVGCLLVALDRDGASGEASDSVVGTVRDDRPEPGVGEVSNLYVHPDWQGEGVGSLLLDAVTERQREEGVTEQHVYVFADNGDAVGFYESKGFETDGRFSAATVDGVDPDCEVLGLTRSV